MEPEDELKMHRETIEIEGGRKLYSYTFTGTETPPADEQEQESS